MHQNEVSHPSNVRLLKVAVAFIWFTTGALVLHPFYRKIGAEYLAQMGLPEWMMYAACAGEVALALWVLRFPADRGITLLQVASIVFFTISLGAVKPALLAHPFGMLTKNLPLLFIVVALYREEQADDGALPLLRVGMALIWITEGIFPKLLFQTQMEVEVVANSGLAPMDPASFLAILGVAQAASGALALLLRGRLLRALLAAQILGLIVLPTLVSVQMPLLWVHPFGPMTKNIPIILGTFVVWRCSR